jgi:hypothetical protein
MTISIKKTGSSYCFLSLLLFIIFSLVTPSLAARGSGEFSEEYKIELHILFEEIIIKVESGEISSIDAKAALASLRSRYRVEYNDFAGKIDAVIDEVEENKKGSLDALNDFTKIQNSVTRAREQIQNEDQNKNTGGGQSEQSELSEEAAPKEGPSSGGGSGSPRKKE